MDDQRHKFQYNATKWMVELELTNNPQVLNIIKFNILMVSKQIKEVELLIYRENKSILVFLELSWFGRKFLKKSIFPEVQEVIHNLLPNFRFRITDDPKIMELAVDLVKKALSGGTYENDGNTNISNVGNKPSEQPIGQSADSEPIGDAQSVQPSDEKSSEVEQTVCDEVVPSDSGQQ